MSTEESDTIRFQKSGNFIQSSKVLRVQKSLNCTLKNHIRASQNHNESKASFEQS